MRAKLIGDRSRKSSLLRARVQGRRGLNQRDPGLFGGGRVVADLLTPKASRQRLVAETGADGNLVTALGATAAEDGGTRLGLHAGKEAVGLGPVAAVGLKGTLRHDKTPAAGDYSCSNF